MNDNDLNRNLKQEVDKVYNKKSSENSTHLASLNYNVVPQCIPVQDSDNTIIVSEIPITSGQLHSIASGNYCMLGQSGEPFAVRFMLKNAFKLKNKNFIVRNIIMQIVAVGKNNAMRRQDIATDVKLQKAETKPKPEKEIIEIEINKDKKEIF